MARTLLLLPGDNPGPITFQSVRKVIDYLAREVGFDVDEDLIGGISIDTHGTPLTDAAFAKTQRASALLYGAVGGPKWLSLPNEKRPSMGMHRLRQGLQLFANVRPTYVYDELISASSFKPSAIKGMDLVVVRELVGGIYAGKPEGVETLPDGQRRGINTLTYTTSEIRRIARVAFEAAAGRRGKVCSAEKATMLRTSMLWREEVKRLHQEEFPQIELSHANIDNVVHDLARDPRQYDVLLGDNMFGDILSDLAAGIAGIPSILPSASLAEKGPDGNRFGLYEQMHVALAIRSKLDKPNPLGTLLALAMAMRYSFGAPEMAARLEKAVAGVIRDGLRAPDMPQEGGKPAVAAEIADAVLAKLR